MPTTPRELRRRIEDTQDDLEIQYDDSPFCEIAHQEFEIAQTPLPQEQRDVMLDQFRAMGYSVPENSIKLTIEHRDFHDAMRRVVLGLDSHDAAQVMSAGLAIGRRIGMAEAAGLLGELNDGDTD